MLVVSTSFGHKVVSMVKRPAYTAKSMFIRNIYFFLFIPVVAAFVVYSDRVFLLGWFIGAMFILFPLDRLLWSIEIELCKSEAEIRSETVELVAEKLLKQLVDKRGSVSTQDKQDVETATRDAEHIVNTVRVIQRYKKK